MKVLKIKVKGLPLFKDELNIDFFARSRVNAEQKDLMNKVFENIYLNGAIAVTGINASGKTTVLKAVSFVLSILKNEPISAIESRDILGESKSNKQVVIETYFSMEDGFINKLETKIESYNNEDGELNYKIVEETLWSKSVTKSVTKSELFQFTSKNMILTRDNNEAFLLEDVSIMVAYNKKKDNHIALYDMSQWTNYNLLNIVGDFPKEFLEFLDPSIEYLKLEVVKDKDLDIRLKFYDKEEIFLTDLMSLNNYLSSGTIKGFNIFSKAKLVFDNGGYLIVDELENHFNLEIVTTLIRFFMDKKTNKGGATLIFSTHYSDILDVFDRNDNIYVTQNRKGILVRNFANILKRNDIKKSDAYQSGLVDGTTPSYEAYMALKKYMRKQFEKRY